MPQANLIHRKTKKTVNGWKYTQGEHPPPPGVSVTMGQHGVLARATTVHGANSVIYDGDWLLDMPNGSRELFTDSFVHAEYRLEGEEEGEDKPVKLG